MLTQQLAAFVINTRESDVPAAVMDGARDALLDTLGCTLAGSLDDARRERAGLPGRATNSADRPAARLRPASGEWE